MKNIRGKEMQEDTSPATGPKLTLEALELLTISSSTSFFTAGFFPRFWAFSKTCFSAESRAYSSSEISGDGSLRSGTGIPRRLAVSWGGGFRLERGTVGDAMGDAGWKKGGRPICR